MGAGIEHGRTTGPKILISFEQGFHAYQETLAAALRILLPDAEVLTVRPEEIGGMASLFGPDVVIGSPLEGVHVEDVPAWVELSLDPAQPSRVNVKGSYSEMVNPTLDKLLVIIEEVAPRS